VHDEERRSTSKVTVVGTGQVGMAAAFAMMTQVAEVYLLLNFFLLVNGNFLSVHHFDADDFAFLLHCEIMLFQVFYMNMPITLIHVHVH